MLEESVLLMLFCTVKLSACSGISLTGVVEDGTGETEDEELSVVVMVDGAVGETMGLDVEVIMVVLSCCCCCCC